MIKMKKRKKLKKLKLQKKFEYNRKYWRMNFKNIHLNEMKMKIKKR